jgi:hypothetical protein
MLIVLCYIQIYWECSVLSVMFSYSCVETAKKFSLATIYGLDGFLEKHNQFVLVSEGRYHYFYNQFVSVSEGRYHYFFF